MNQVIIESVNSAREQGKKIGLVQGSWDMFHIGHLAYLQKARELCDYLIVGMDDDEKIRFRKGNKRPIIPLEERYEMIRMLGIADFIAVKSVREKHWELIKTIRPDVLVAIKENYSDEDIIKLGEYCGEVAILPRQAKTSTSDIVRKTLILNGVQTVSKKDARVLEAIGEFKVRIGFSKEMTEPLPELVSFMKNSTDWKVPVAACCYHDGKMYFGSNQIDQGCPDFDRNNRSELFYATVEHAEINLLKQLNGIEKIDSPVWVTLFPCDKCMKVLKDKGVKEIYYLEDHPERNWSKRAHQIAIDNGIKTIQIGQKKEIIEKTEEQTKLPKFKYIDPRNVRYQKQLDIMLDREAKDEDPFDPEIIDQDILFTRNHWYVSQNRFPYDAIEYQILIIAKNPIYKIDEMSKEMWEELKEIMDYLREEFKIPGGALCYRFGDTQYSGASLKRLHAHLIVPKKEMKTKFTIGGNAVMKKELRLDYKPEDNK